MLYPTAAKLVSGLCLAVLAFVVSLQVMETMPPQTDFGIFLPFNIVLGFAVGWLWLGPRSGEGGVTAISYGLTAAALLLVVGLFAQGANEMMRKAMLNRYGGPFEAVGAIFEEALAFAQKGLGSESLITLAVGGVITGLLTDWTAKRFS